MFNLTYNIIYDLPIHLLQHFQAWNDNKVTTFEFDIHLPENW